MVVSNSKFLCGAGCVTLHYCKICGEPHTTSMEAKRCEESHLEGQDALHLATNYKD
jgi:hypothetical protein